MKGHPKGWKFPMGYSPWNKTKIDENWLLEQAKNRSSNDIAKELGLNGRTIRMRLTKLGFKMPLSERASKFNIGILRSPETCIGGPRGIPIGAGLNRGHPNPHGPDHGSRVRGKDHWLWKGGNRKERNGYPSQEYKSWRKAVFERDDYTCQICGIRGGTLHADHLKRWKEHPESRYDVENGRTLCVPCHRKTPTYGNRKQVEEGNVWVGLTA